MPPQPRTPATNSDPLGLGVPSLTGDTSKNPFIGVDVDPTDQSGVQLGGALGIPTDRTPPWATVDQRTGPNGYDDPSAPRGPTQTRTLVRYPRYRESDVATSLRSLTTEALARLQARMVTAGLIDKKERFHFGVADDVTFKANYSLLEFANRYGVTAEDALTQLESSPLKSTAGTTSTSTNSQTYLTPKAQGQTTLRQAFQEELGRAPTDREYRAYQKALNAQEQASPATSVTTSTTSDAGDSTSSTVTTPSAAPSAEAFADQQVHGGALGVERNTKKAVNYMDVAMSVLGAGGSGASFGG